MVRVKDFQGPVVGISEKRVEAHRSKPTCRKCGVHIWQHVLLRKLQWVPVGILIYICIYIYTYIYMIMKYSQYVCMILYDYQIYKNLIEIGYLIFFSGPGRGGSFTIPSLMSCLAPDTSWTSFCSCAHCPPGFTRAPRCWASQVTSKSN